MLVTYVDGFIHYKSKTGEMIYISLEDLCTMIKVESISLLFEKDNVLISERGEYNVVVYGIIDETGKEIVIRLLRQSVSNYDKDLLMSYAKENNNSRIMDENEIGPQVYYPHEIFEPRDAYNYGISYKFSPNSKRYADGKVPFFVTEYFNQGDLWSFLMGGGKIKDVDVELTTEQVFNMQKEAVKKAVDLIDKSVETGIYCIDVKPSNFVVDVRYYEDKRQLVQKTRMIDFDSCYTSLSKLVNIKADKKEKEHFLKIVLTIQFLSNMLYHLEYIRREYKITDKKILDSHEEILIIITNKLDELDYEEYKEDVRTILLNIDDLTVYLAHYSGIFNIQDVCKNAEQYARHYIFSKDEKSYNVVKKCIDNIFENIYKFSKNYSYYAENDLFDSEMLS